MDFLRELGGLGLELRFRRLSQSLREEADRVYRHYGFAFHERWCPLFLLLRRRGPLTIIDISRHLGRDHAAILRITRPMREEGLLEVHKDRLDGSKRLMKLTPKAEEMAPQLEEVWHRLSESHLTLFRAAQCEVLPILERVENALERKDLSTRVVEDEEDSVSSA